MERNGFYVHTYKFHNTCQNIKDRCSNLPYTTIPLQPRPSPPTPPLHPALTTSIPKPPRRHTKTIRNTHRHPPTTRPSSSSRPATTQQAKKFGSQNPTKIAGRQRRKRARWKAEALFSRSARQMGNRPSFAELGNYASDAWNESFSSGGLFWRRGTWWYPFVNVYLG